MEGPVDWYEVTRSGFDYVDEKCDAYLSALYRIRRDRDASTSQLAALGGTSTAILGFTGAAQKAILITAASFGLATQLTDNASSSLLFAMDPSDVQSLVKSQTDAYRAGAAAQQENYRTSNAAMEGIRGYLNLCLPVSIEAQVKAALQGTLYVAKTTGYGVPALNRVQTSSVNSATINPTRKEIATGKIYVPPPIPKDRASVGLTANDVYIAKSEMKVLQGKLCVTADGDIGGDQSSTRAAIRTVQQFNLMESRGFLDVGTKATINAMKICDTTVHQNTFEHLALNDPAEIAAVKNALKGYTEAKEKTLEPGTKDLVTNADFLKGESLNGENRKVISAIQKSRTGMTVDGGYSATLRDLLDPYMK
ncbi:hypothetical protein [Rhizobium laguerreae]|uniref:hypothetical protein n=1 Tax=Rhizobium laguerreae TaxID=1076926 RepID=UPI001C910FC4|nr:hypothetical protein [Rhizobium laguerreae]MBY3378925.1 hypothetical protein [Rhizobium laguerreae]